LEVDICCSEVALADIFETLVGRACGQFSVEQVLGNATIPHAMHVTVPHETALAREEMHAYCASLFQKSCVCDPVFPCVIKDAAEAAKVEAH
jgi:hypothetical protein